MVCCIARALVFSGRRDPEWELEISIWQQIESLIVTCKFWTGKEIEVPILGYRGCQVNCNDGSKLFIYKNFIKHTIDKQIIIKQDDEMQIELLIVLSAPKEFNLSELIWPKKSDQMN